MVFVLIAGCTQVSWVPAGSEIGHQARAPWNGALFTSSDGTIQQFASVADDIAWNVTVNASGTWIAGETGDQAVVCELADCDSDFGSSTALTAASSELRAVADLGVNRLVYGKVYHAEDFDSGLSCVGSTSGASTDVDYVLAEVDGTGAVVACLQGEVSLQSKDEGLAMAVDTNYRFTAARVSAGGGLPSAAGRADVRVTVYNTSNIPQVSFDISSDPTGGHRFDEPQGIAIIPAPNNDNAYIYVAGVTGGDLVAEGNFNATFGSDHGDWDGFLAQLYFNATAGTLTPNWVYQFGTDGQDASQAVAITPNKGVVVVGRFEEDRTDGCDTAVVPTGSIQDAFVTYFELDTTASPYVPKGAASFGGTYPVFDVRGDCDFSEAALGVVANANSIAVVGASGGDPSHADEPAETEDGVLATYAIINETSSDPAYPYLKELSTSPTLFTIDDASGGGTTGDRALGIALYDGILYVVGQTKSDLELGTSPPADFDAYLITYDP